MVLVQLRAQSRSRGVEQDKATERKNVFFWETEQAPGEMYKRGKKSFRNLNHTGMNKNLKINIAERDRHGGQA